MAVPDHEIGILADLERTHPVFDVELYGGVDGDEIEGVLFGNAAVAHSLGGLIVQTSRQVAAVGVEGHDDTGIMHNSAAVRDGVVGLQLVTPPVGEARDHCAVLGDLMGDFVAFETVLEGSHLEAELLRHPQHHQHLVLPVGVRVGNPLPVENLDEGLEPKVVPWWNAALLLLLGEGVVLLPFTLVVESLDKSVADGLLNAHASVRVAVRAALDVLAEGELERRLGPLEKHLLWPCRLEAQLDNCVLPADGVC